MACLFHVDLDSKPTWNKQAQVCEEQSQAQVQVKSHSLHF